MVMRGLLVLLTGLILLLGSCANVQDTPGGVLGLLLREQGAIALSASAQQGFRRKLTFTNTAGTLTDFPVLLVLSEGLGNIDYASIADDGADLCFTDADGTALDHELELWDETGTSYVWVRVPSIAGSTTSDHIWMGYGQGSDCAQNSSGVWNSNYAGVWHMNNDPAASQILDSKNSNHGAPQSMSAANLTATDTGNGLDLNGTNQYIQIPDDASLRIGSDITIEALVRWDGPETTSAYILEKGDTDQDNYAMYIWDNAPGCTIKNNCLGMEIRDAGNVYRSQEENTSAQVVPAGAWAYLVIVLDSGANALRFYKNGTLIREETGITWDLNDTYTHDLFIGRQNYGAADFSFDGIIDEVRISSTARSTDYIQAQGQSLLNNTGFINYGAEEEL